MQLTEARLARPGKVQLNEKGDDYELFKARNPADLSGH